MITLTLQHGSNLVLLDLLHRAVGDVQGPTEEGQPQLVPQQLREGSLLLAIVGKFWPNVRYLLVIVQEVVVDKDSNEDRGHHLRIHPYLKPVIKCNTLPALKIGIRFEGPKSSLS